MMIFSSVLRHGCVFPAEISNDRIEHADQLSAEKVLELLLSAGYEFTRSAPL